MKNTLNILIVSCLLIASAAHSQVITVTSTADNTNPGTLRHAITEVNAGNYNHIQFSFTGNGPHVIALSSALPTIAYPTAVATLTIDGTNQSNSQVHQVIIDGGNQNIVGIYVDKPNFTTVKNLIFNGFGSPTDNSSTLCYALRVDGGGSVYSGGKVTQNNVRIENNVLINNKIGIFHPHQADVVHNFIGVNQNGQVVPNGYGIYTGYEIGLSYIRSLNCRFGLPADATSGNVISGNLQDGVHLVATRCEFYRNYIGTNASGNNIGNQGCGIRLTDYENYLTENWIGDHNTSGCTDHTSKQNIIAFNGEDGINVSSGGPTFPNVFINQNKIYLNGDKPIDLNYTSPPPGLSPGNQSVPAPTISSFDVGAGDISGSIGASSAGNIIEIFASNAQGDALQYIGCTTTNGSGLWSASGLNFQGYSYATVSVTSPYSVHNTSELSGPEYSFNCTQYNLSAAFSFNPGNPTAGNATTLTYTGSGANVTSFEINWGDGTSTTTGGGLSNGQTFTHTYNSAGAAPINFTVNGIEGCSQVEQMEIEISECCLAVMNLAPPAGEAIGETGQFYFDNQTGRLIFRKANCPAEYDYNCVKKTTAPNNVSGVMEVAMNTLSDQWGYTFEYYPPSTQWSSDPFENGTAGKWRTKDQFAYIADLDQSQGVTYRNYNRGTFAIEMFDWDYPGNNDPDKWVRTNRTNSYTPNGFPDEDENLKTLKSAAQYGYDNKLLMAVADRAERYGFSFESFERLYDGTKFENYTTYESSFSEQLSVSNAPVHSGNYSLELKSDPGADGCMIGRLKMNYRLVEYGVLLRAWFWVDPAKEAPGQGTTKYMRLSIKQEGVGSWQNPTTKWTKIAQSGEWMLYEILLTEADINTTSITTSSVQTSTQYLEIQLVVNGWGAGGTDYATGDIYMDDLRIGPRDGAYECYVYDPSERIVAKFDDRHFGLFYQYNAEGALVRKLKETERGVKTISETYYNSQGENNYN